MTHGSWLYVATAGGGIAVIDATDPAHPRLVGRVFEGRVFSRLLIDGETLVALEAREEALTLSLVNPREPALSRSVPVQLAMPIETRAAEPPRPAVELVGPTVKVIDVLGGRVIFEGGLAAGFKPGSHVQVRSQRLVAKPDLASGGTVEVPSGEVSAVLVVEQAEEHRAMAILGRGDLAQKGDLVERTNEPTSERLMFPRRAPFTWRAGFQVRPFLGLEGQSKPVGFVLDGFLAWYASSFPFAVLLSASPVSFALNASEAHYPGAVALSAAYVTDYFELGLGLGALYGNAGPCMQGPLDPASSCEVNTGVTINQRLRLGALDGFHFEWTSAVFSRPDRFVFGLGRGEVAIPFTSRLGLFAAGGAGENGWMFGELGLRTWVSGAGAPGTLILSASLGYAAIFDGPTRDMVGGPSMSFGMEWRL